MSEPIPICAQISVLYALRAPVSITGSSAPVNSSLHERHLPGSARLAISHDTVSVTRPIGAEYANGQTLTYEVESIEAYHWAMTGLPPVVEARLAITTQEMGGIVSAVKDLYDPQVDVLIGKENLLDHMSRLVVREPCPVGHRSVIVDLSESELPRADHGEGAHEPLIAQLLCKDTSIAFGLEDMSVSRPKDLNAAFGNEVYIWAEETLIWRLEPRFRTSWAEQIIAVNAFVTAARDVTEMRLRDVQSARDASSSPEDTLRRFLSAEAAHETFVQARLDVLRMSLGRPMAAYTESLAQQSTVLDSCHRLRTLLDQNLRVIALEAQLAEKESARQSAVATADVRTVVTVFAIVSVLANAFALALAIVSVPPDSGSRFRHVPFGVAAAALTIIGAAALAVILVVSSRSTAIPTKRRRHAFVAASFAVAALCGLVIAAVVRSGSFATISLVGAGIAAVAGAILLARTLRLAASQ